MINKSVLKCCMCGFLEGYNMTHNFSHDQLLLKIHHLCTISKTKLWITIFATQFGIHWNLI
jgi:hypothetical protein